MTTIEKTFCKCGCGEAVTGGKEYFSGACRTRAHRQQKKSEIGTDAAVTGEETDQQPVTGAPGEAARQISEKAAHEIATLQARIQELGQEQQALGQERQQLLTDQAGRADHRQQLRSGVAALEQAHQDALSYASVAQDTIGEPEAVRQVNAAFKAIEPARVHAQQIEAQYDIQDATATARLQEIDTTLSSIAADSQQAYARLAEVERVRDRAVIELGQHTYEALMREYQTYQDKLADLKQQALEAQIERAAMLERARETLHAWPELVRKVAGLDEYDDATARVLRTALGYVDVLIADGPNVTRSMNLPAANHWPYTWLGALEVSRDVLFVNETLGGPKVTLRQHQRLLRALLDQYVATKR